jgi:hypothetical protein
VIIPSTVVTLPHSPWHLHLKVVHGSDRDRDRVCLFTVVLLPQLVCPVPNTFMLRLRRRKYPDKKSRKSRKIVRKGNNEEVIKNKRRMWR